MSTSAGKKLYISLLQQNTFVAIDEEGTEAAAVTIVGITTTSAPAVTEMRVDRPYIFVIRERLSGTILFMGKIARLP
jgi:serpin B